MAYRILADENVERATVNVLRKPVTTSSISGMSLNWALVPTTLPSSGTPATTIG
jgi:hypothetical protein